MRILCAVMLLATTASAASFDCSKAASPTEKMICATPRLSSLDDELAATWKAVPKTDAVREAQRQWLVSRNECDELDDCIEAEYLRRIATLRLGNRTLFAKQKPPASVAGRYAEKTDVCVENDEGENDCEAEVENYIDIRRGKGNALTVSSELYFYMGHMCNLENEPAEWVGNELRVAVLHGDEPVCVLLLRFKDGELYAFDPVGYCRGNACGARATFHDLILPKVKAKR